MRIIFKNTDLVIAKNANLFNGVLIEAFNPDNMTVGSNLQHLINSGDKGNGYFDVANAIDNRKQVYLYNDINSVYVPLDKDVHARVLCTDNDTNILEVKELGSSNVIPVSPVSGVTKRFICYNTNQSLKLGNNTVITEVQL